MKYIIICEERGIFLGTYARLGFFSMLDEFGSYKAPLFDTLREAVDYSKKYMDVEKEHKYMYPSFKTGEKYVSVIDIVKAGYGQYAGDMMSNLPNYSNTMH